MHVVIFKCLYGLQGFCGFGISYNTLKCIQTKKKEFQCFFAMNSSFKFPASAMPNEVDRVMDDC